MQGSSSMCRRRGSAWHLVLILVCGAFFIGDAPAASRGQVLFKDPAGEQVGLYRDSYALLIGESRYTRGWPPLESVPRELDLLEAALKEQGFHVVKRLDLDGQALRDAFVQFIRRYGRAPDNRLLFYFAGHGHTLERGWGREMGYIVPADAPSPEKDVNGFKDKAVSMGQVLLWARDIDAKHALFVFDSCFSGSVFAARDLPKRPPHISRLTAEPVREFITAGSAGETVPARSVFTPAFVDALRYRLGDLDKDGYVTGMELGVYLQGKVPQHADQTPQFGKIRDYELSRGDFVFEVGAAQLPSTVQKPPPEPVQPRGGEPTAFPFARTPAAAAPKAGDIWTEPLNGMQFVWVPRGCFQMGSPLNEPGRFDSERQHEVCVEGFWMGKYEVTNGQYRKFKPAHDSGQYDGRSLNADDQPVVRVGWHDATAYAEWLSRQTGRHYRLPAEAQWEYAARAGTNTAYWWGNDIGRNRANCAGCGSQWDGRQSAPVGSFDPNLWGLHDTVGNVWEWTCSVFSKDYGGSEERCAGQDDAGGKRVVRGGSWLYGPGDLRSAGRSWFSADARTTYLGFRLAQDL